MSVTRSWPGKWQFALAYGWLCAGHVFWLVSLLSHRSGNTAILGRYSPKYAAMILAVTIFALFWLALLVWIRQGLPGFLTWTLVYLQRVPGLLEAVSAAGFCLTAGVFLFAALLEPYVSLPWFLGGWVLGYGGYLLLLSAFLKIERRRIFTTRFALMLFGVGLALLIGEWGLRFSSRFTPYRVLPPGLYWEFHPVPELLPGIEGVSVYTTNEDGIRGDPVPASGRFRILTIGGSTTECVYLDNAEAWPYLLQEQLNRQGHEPPVWVGNIGRSGHGLVEHFHALRHFAPQYRLDAVVMLVGINDLTPVLWEPETYDPEGEDPENYLRFLNHSFYSRPLVDAAITRPFPQNLAFWNLVEQNWRQKQHPLVGIHIEDRAGQNYAARRQLFQKAPRIIHDLPDLTGALQRYRENLVTLIDSAHSQGIRLVFVTQPAIWSDRLSSRAEHLLWFGLYGQTPNPTGRYAVTALATALERFNQTLRMLCRERETACVDLASDMMGREDFFYDDVHFNEAGARFVAARLADFFLAGHALPNQSRQEAKR